MNTLDQRCKATVDQLVDCVEGLAGWTADDLVQQMEDLSTRQREIVLHYWDCRRNGCEPRLAEMLALQAPPMSNTDREFLEGHCNGSQFAGSPMANDMGNKYAAVAKERGVSIKGKVYLSGLARYPGDPKAWVSDRGDVKRIAEEQNLAIQGSVDHKPDGRIDDQH